jgi:hypothetical protein
MLSDDQDALHCAVHEINIEDSQYASEVKTQPLIPSEAHVECVPARRVTLEAAAAKKSRLALASCALRLASHDATRQGSRDAASV